MHPRFGIYFNAFYTTKSKTTPSVALLRSPADIYCGKWNGESREHLQAQVTGSVHSTDAQD